MVWPCRVAGAVVTPPQGKEKAKTHIRDRVEKRAVHPNSRKARQMNKATVHSTKLARCRARRNRPSKIKILQEEEHACGQSRRQGCEWNT